MPDEIDLLRSFRADVPEPDDAAWNRARTALAEARALEAGPQGTPGRRPEPLAAAGSAVTISTVVAVVAAVAALIAASCRGRQRSQVR